MHSYFIVPLYSQQIRSILEDTDVIGLKLFTACFLFFLLQQSANAFDAEARIRAEAAFREGVAAESAGDNARAMRAFTQALEADPDYGPAWLRRGRLQLKATDYTR